MKDFTPEAGFLYYSFQFVVKFEEVKVAPLAPTESIIHCAHTASTLLTCDSHRLCVRVCVC